MPSDHRPKETFEEWLAEHAQGTGVLGAGLLHRDRTCYTCTYSEDYPREELDAAWMRLADTVQNLGLCRVHPYRTLWTFEHGQLQFVLRPDGVALGLLTVGYPVPPDPNWVESLVQDFLRL